MKLKVKPKYKLDFIRQGLHRKLYTCGLGSVRKIIHFCDLHENLDSLKVAENYVINIDLSR